MTNLLSPARRQKYARFFPLIEELVKRDLKLKYRRSVLGYFWSMLNPLLMMVIMTMVFSYMFRFDIPNYPLYLICGQTLFNCFSDATNKAMMSVIDNGNLIKKVYIPKFIFPLSKVTSCFVNVMFSLAAILLVMLFTRTPFHWPVLLFWAPIVCMYLFSCGVGLVISALSVQFRDVTHLYSVLLMAWMYITPIFYPISIAPDWVQVIIHLNPMYIFIDTFRQLVLMGTVPGALTWLSCAGVSVLSLLVGGAIFGKMQRNFIFYV